MKQRNLLLPLATLLVCVTFHNSRFTAAAAPATQPTTQSAASVKPIYDALAYKGKPDLRPLGLTPLYVAYDGNLNRATADREQANNFPSSTDRSAYAFRRVARDAAALEPGIPDHALVYPEYDSVPQSVCFDLEDPRTMAALDAAAEREPRQKLIRWLARRLDDVRDEWATYNVQGLTVGMFFFPPAPYGVEHPLDARRPAWEAAAAIDLLPLVRGVDCFYVEAYYHRDGFAAWRNALRAEIARCRALDPAKPVYVFVTPYWGHYAAASLAGSLLPADAWRQIFAAANEDADGVVLWTGADPTDKTGVRLRQWDERADWWRATQQAISKR